MAAAPDDLGIKRACQDSPLIVFPLRLGGGHVDPGWHASRVARPPLERHARLAAESIQGVTRPVFCLRLRGMTVVAALVFPGGDQPRFIPLDRASIRRVEPDLQGSDERLKSAPGVAGNANTKPALLCAGAVTFG